MDRKNINLALNLARTVVKLKLMRVILSTQLQREGYHFWTKKDLTDLEKTNFLPR